MKEVKVGQIWVGKNTGKRRMVTKIIELETHTRVLLRSLDIEFVYEGSWNMDDVLDCMDLEEEDE